jgi:hypothetical protein
MLVVQQVQHDHMGLMLVEFLVVYGAILFGELTIRLLDRWLPPRRSTGCCHAEK